MNGHDTGVVPDPGCVDTAADPARSLVNELRADQGRRWAAGDRAPAEEFVARLPAGADEDALVLVWGEVLLRQARGEQPSAEEYARRFPAWADRLALQFEFEAALGGGLTAPGTSRSPRTGPAADPGRGEPFGYVILEEVGWGGMGVVYRAWDALLNRDVAVKVLRDHIPAGSPTARRFLEEAQITGQLEHPGIPPVHEVGELPDGRPFLVMKLIKGHTLATLLNDAAADRRRLVAAFEQVCQAVAYAHANGVIHRDLKPQNVMVGAYGEVQVMDWGLAKRMRNAECGMGDEDTDRGVAATRSLRSGACYLPAAGDVTAEGAILGTPAFMAPEQARGEVEKVDERADAFGLGAVLCAILTGNPPYGGTGSDDMLGAAARGDLDEAFARLARCGADPELVALCRRCLSRDPDDRPADAGAVATAVAAYRVGVEERLRRAELDRATTVVRAAELAKRRRVQAVLAAAVLVILAGGVGFAWWHDWQESARLLEEERRKSAEFRAETEAENARTTIHKLLAAAADLRKRYRFDDAEVTLDQAERLTAKGAADLSSKVADAKADLTFVRELSDIRMKRSVWVVERGGRLRPESRTSPAEYRKAFAARGLDPVTGKPAEVAASLRASAVAELLVAGLDDWAVLEPDPAVRDRVLEVARLANPGPWLDRFRDPKVRANPFQVWGLARDAKPAELKPGTVTALSRLMERSGLDPTRMLLAAQLERPDDFLIPFALGGWYSHTRQYAEAATHYRAARVAEPTNLAALFYLAATLCEGGKLREAVETMTKAGELAPDNPVVLHNLAIVLAKAGDLPGAVAAVEKAIRLDRDYGNAHNHLGTYLSWMGHTDGAVAAYRAAIRANPKLAWPHNNLGLIAARRGQLKEAIAHFDKAIQLNPRFAQAHTNLGDAWEAAGDLTRAIASYQKAIEIDSTDPRTLTNLGSVLDRAGKPGAAGCYREAIGHDPTYARAHHYLGLVQRSEGNIRAALASFRAAVVHDPEDIEALLSLGATLCDNERDYDGAEKAFRAAVRLAPKDFRVHTNLGHALLGKGDLIGARDSFRAAVGFGPQDAEAHAGLGGALLLLGELDDAIVHLEKAVRLDSGLDYARGNLKEAQKRKAERDAKTAPPPRPARPADTDR